MTRTVLASALTALILGSAGARPAAVAPTLAHFKNYFLTGDYVVGGASLWRKGVDGRATETIEIDGVPDGVDVVAAFLYVQTAERQQWSGIDHARFDGIDLGPGTASMAKALNWEAATSPCWSVPWGGKQRRLVTYRADVLRFLPIGEDGKTRANGQHVVEVPDTGIWFADTDEGGIESGGGQGPRAIGAGLVIVYRDPARPFRAIVIRDGGITKHAFSTMSVELPGFYQASADPDPRLTPLVGDGRPFLSERVYFNGQLIAANPFASTAGPKWDAPTFANLPLAPGASTAALQVAPGGLLSDCLSFSAIVFSTSVQDSDDDGLLDVWESSETAVLDPTGQPLPNLKAMGAHPDQKDVFIEIGYMFTEDDPSPEIGPPGYGGVPQPAHTHRPTHAALKLAGDMLANAPTGRINAHFDLGDAYPHGEADQYIIRGSGLARGGEAINELATVCQRAAGDSPQVCQFSDYPGTVGWKTGFQFIRDEVLSGPAPLPDGTDPCDAPGSTCVRRFDRNRKDIFRYALFAHAVGLPKSEDPSDPDFHVPRTNTGVGDFPGGDFIVSLGAFADDAGLPVGTPFMQASTMMHEMGHGFERRHGGEALQPNCKPLYFSVMNYLYQLRGLLDDGGVPHLDFSRDDFGGRTIDETSLIDGSLSLLPYRLGWYAPLETSYLGALGTPVTKHCNGSPLLPTDPAMVRIDARTSAGAIDWRADGVLDASPIRQDVNFNGLSTLSDLSPELLGGSNDWMRILVNQTASRRSAGGLFFDGMGRAWLGPLSLDAGRGDLGRGDLGRGDLGRGDLGRGDLGRGDLGRGDLGRGDLGTVLGRGDLGRGDLGGGDLFVGSPDEPFGELDFETAVTLAKTPPNEFRACVIGQDCPSGITPLHRVRLDWASPTVGAVAQYEVVRVAGPELTPDAVATAALVGRLTAVPGQVSYTLTDLTPLENGQPYTYFARAAYLDGTISDPSNIVTVVGVNDPPSAAADSYSTDEDMALAIAAPGVLANDTDADGSGMLQAVLVTGPSHGTVTLKPDGAFLYTPSPDYNGADSFTYRAADGAASSAPATVSITIRPVDDGPPIAFVNVQNAPPPPGAVAKRGSTIPMKWAFKSGKTLVDSAGVVHIVTVTGPLPGGPFRTFTNTDPGGSSFRYSASSRTWTFNLQTKEGGSAFPAGSYDVTIAPAAPGYPSASFRIKLVK